MPEEYPFLRNPVETELQCNPRLQDDLLSFVNVLLQDWVISDKKDEPLVRSKYGSSTEESGDLACSSPPQGL